MHVEEGPFITVFAPAGLCAALVRRLRHRC